MKYLISLFICLFTLTSYSEEIIERNRKIRCASFKLIFESLTSEEFNEHPIWVGINEEDGSQTAVMVNNKTLTWTIIQYDNKNACVLNIGEGFKFKSPSK